MGEDSVDRTVLFSDRFLDRVLDKLEKRASLGQVGDLARWDLLHAIRETLEELDA